MMPTQPAGDILLTPGAVAALLFVTPKTVTRWAVAGKLNSLRTPGGHRRYLKSDVIAIISELHPDQVAQRARYGSGETPPPRPAGTAMVVPAPREAPPTGRRPIDDAGPQAAAAAVVAEAVAVALAAAAADAAEEVLVTVAAVHHAAQRASEAAQTARGAREFAAAAAADTVARDAARTATRVQFRADVAATQVKDAAAQAAEDLVRSIEDGETPDAPQIALLLDATVRAAADKAAQETQRAAATVAHAVAAAASHVASTVAAAEANFEDQVDAAAYTLEQEAKATAGQVARGTDARAAGVAIAAREAAAALMTSSPPRSRSPQDVWLRQRGVLVQGVETPARLIT